MTPQNSREMFNMRHTKARNIIERAFAIVKMRWGILRSASFYPIQTQIWLILSCFLLHNYIRGEMAVDPRELELDNAYEEVAPQKEHDDNVYVDMIEPTAEWNNKRNELAEAMWLNVSTNLCVISLLIHLLLTNTTWLCCEPGKRASSLGPMAFYQTLEVIFLC